VDGEPFAFQDGTTQCPPVVREGGIVGQCRPRTPSGSVLGR
jgi:hypothetical protein